MPINGKDHTISTYDEDIDIEPLNTDSQINILQTPLHCKHSDNLIKHYVVDSNENILDSWNNHTYGDTIDDSKDPEVHNPNVINSILRTEHEDELKEEGPPSYILKHEKLSKLYKFAKYRTTSTTNEYDLITKYLNQLNNIQDYPAPMDHDKLHSNEGTQRFIYPIKIDENILQSVKCGHINSQEIHQAFEQLISDYDHTIAKTWADCGVIKGVYLKLDLKPGAKPFKYKPYKSSYTMQDEIEEQCTKLFNAGFIIPSDSQYASPVLMIPKKLVTDKLEWRMCMDYRQLNSMTVKDHYPLPNMSSLHRKFLNKNYFTSLDLRHAYHHILIRPEDRHKTAFITHKGLWEWIRMTFGFVNAPSTFQRAINYIFRDCKFVLVYIDDILILSDTEEEHMEHLKLVFNRLSEYNLKIRLDKCSFFQKELKYLGFILNKYGQRPDPVW